MIDGKTVYTQGTITVISADNHASGTLGFLKRVHELFDTVDTVQELRKTYNLRYTKLSFMLCLL